MSSRRSSASSPKLELELNLSPPRANSPIDSPNASESSSEIMSMDGSCVSSEPEDQTMHYPSRPEAKAMVLAGCPRCLMYFMLSGVDPKCPKCKSTVLLAFLNEESPKRI